MLSVIIPTYNDMSLTYLKKNLNFLSAIPEIELICIDGGSTDGTCELIRDSGARLEVMQNATSRAALLNRGIEAASNDLLLLHHPRSTVDSEGFRYLINNAANLKWGGFTHVFDRKTLLLNFTSWYSNQVRGKIKGIIYLDHCIFLKKSLLTPPKVPEVPIFEDTLLSYKLKKMESPTILPFAATTSAIRFEKSQLRQLLLNVLVKILFHFKVSPQTISRIYEQGFELNKR